MFKTADAQLASALTLLRTMRRAEKEDETVSTLFASLFDNARRSPLAAKIKFESSAARESLYKLRDVLELVLALPSTYLAQEAKERSSMAVLVLDRILHAMLPSTASGDAMEEEDAELVRQAALAVSSTCRRYLAAMLRTLRPEAVRPTTTLCNVSSYLTSLTLSLLCWENCSTDCAIKCNRELVAQFTARSRNDASSPSAHTRGGGHPH
jgi:hypothetical protein